MSDQPNAPRTSRVLIPVILLAAWALVYFPIVSEPAPPMISGMGDAWGLYGPLLFFMDDALRRGELPLWNPMVLCGAPFAGNPQTTLFYPPNLVRSILTTTPTPAATHTGMMVLVALHSLLAALFTYRYARVEGCSRSGGLAAALVFVFNGAFVRCGLSYQFVGTVAWFPALLLAVRYMHLSPLAWRPIAGAGLAGGMALLGGFPQVALFMWLASAAYLLGRRLLGERRIGGVARDGLGLGMAFVLAMAVSAAMLLPTTEFALQSSRRLGVERLPDFWDGSLRTVLEQLVVYSAAGEAPNLVRGAGVVALLLAAAATLHSSRRTVLLHVLVLLLLLDASLGAPMPISSLMEMLAPIPMHNPTRAWLFASFPFALLVGLGLDAVTRRSSRTVAATAALGLLGVLLLTALVAWSGTEGPFAAGPGTWLAPALGVLVVVAASRGWLVRLAAGAIPLLLLLEIALWCHSYVPDLIASRPVPWPERLEQRSRDLAQDNQRWTSRWPNGLIYRLRPTITGYDPLQLARMRRFLCQPGSEDTYKRIINRWATTAVNQRGNLLCKRRIWLVGRRADGPMPDKHRLFPPTEAAFGVPTSSLPRVNAESLLGRALSRESSPIPVSFSPTRVKVSRLDASDIEIGPLSMPDAHAVLRVTYRAAGAGEIRPVLHDTVTGREELGAHTPFTAAPGDAAVVDIPLPDLEELSGHLGIWIDRTEPRRWFELRGLSVVADESDQTHLLDTLSLRANTISARVRDLPAPHLLLVTEAAHPGWQAVLDGAPAPILGADDVFQAVEVPKGTHEVRLDYRPWSVRLGLFLSLLTALLLGTAWKWTPRSD